MEVAVDSSLSSFYSSVVNEVVDGLSQPQTGIDASVVELLKNEWMKEYSALSGFSLDLNRKEDSSSEEEDVVQVNSNTISSGNEKLSPIILSTNIYSIKVPGSISFRCPDIFSRDGCIIPQADGVNEDEEDEDEEDDSYSSDSSEPKEQIKVTPIVVTKKTATLPTYNKKSSLFTLSSLSKPVSVSQVKSLGSLSSTVQLPKKIIKGTRFKPKASEASAVRPLIPTIPSIPSKSTVDNEIQPSTSKKRPIIVNQESSVAKEAKTVVVKKIPKPVPSQENNAANTVTEQSRVHIQMQMNETGPSTIILSRHEFVKHYQSRWILNLVDGIVKYKNQEILFGKSSCNFIFD